MNTHTFHDQATITPPELPAVTAGELATMSAAAHSRHVDRVLTWAAGRYLDTTATDQLRTALDLALRYNEATPPGSKTILALSGPNGAGKSTFTKRWASAYYRQAITQHPVEGKLPRWSPSPGVSADLAPLVWVNLPSRAKMAEVDTQILSFLRVGHSGSLREMTLRTVRALARHRVKVVVIDDAHLLKTVYASGRDVLDHLKHLNTELGEIGGTLVLVGANLEGTPLTTDPQIAARLRLFTLHPLPATTTEDKTAWKHLLGELETQLLPALPNAQPGFLTDKLAGRLHARTGGYVAETATLLKHATVQATLTRTGTITRDIVDAAPVSLRSLTAGRHA